MSSPSPTSQTKRIRLDFEESNMSSNRPKYPFVDFDSWMVSMDLGTSDPESTQVEYVGPSPTNPVPNYIRNQPTWFAFNEEAKITTECMSAQYSNVAHSPFVQAFENTSFAEPTSRPPSEATWIDRTLLSKYMEIKSMQRNLRAPAYYQDPDFRIALVSDIVANVARRDPLKYTRVHWPGEELFGATSSDTEVALGVCNTWDDGSFSLARAPWEWEEQHRVRMLKEISKTYESLIDFGDMIIPIRGLVCSVFFAGEIFRLGQLFQKLSIVKSPLTMLWDDQAFIVCVGKKRKGNKYVEKAVKLMRRLIVEPSDDRKWGFSVPPVCLKDPTVCTWIREMNRGLMSGLVYEKHSCNFTTLEKWVSVLRIKKYVYWREAKEERLVGFYFGSFNPVHENHIALARYAHDMLGFEKIFLVPNQGSHEDKKEVMVSIEHRSAMLKIRITTEPGLEFIETFEPVGNTQKWETKANIAEGTTNRLFENSRYSGQPVLILGQDSWNKAVIGSSRDKTTRHFIGIAKIVKSKIFVFPRFSDEQIVNPPKPIRELVRFIEEYSDPIKTLSSSTIRNALNASDRSTLIHIDGLHPTVLEYILRNSLYK